MEFSDYQKSIRETDQRPGDALEDITVHLLGLAGEAGSVASAYKKYIRDGAADSGFKLRMREELGDVLWYVATITDHLKLNLDEVASANLDKTRGRWLLGTSDPLDFGLPRGRAAAPNRHLRVHPEHQRRGASRHHRHVRRCRTRRPAHRQRADRRRLSVPRRLPPGLRDGARLVAGHARADEA